MNIQHKIAAGIILYNPDLERLRENINAILPQVDAVYVVDNASANADTIRLLLEQFGLNVLRNDSNLGVACALNQLMKMAQAEQIEWLLTLDQDSVSPHDLMRQLASRIDSFPRAGILCPVIMDRSFGIEHPPTPTQATTSLQECITSASLTRLDAWLDVGGFDQRLFIDAVDTDFCLSLHEHGWEVIQVNSACLIHEIGHEATKHIIFGRSYIAFNHAPLRYYYIARNMVFISRKHTGFLRPAPWRAMLTMTMRMFVILLWEREQRLLKCYKILKGMIDGCRLPLQVIKDLQS